MLHRNMMKDKSSREKMAARAGTNFIWS